MVGLPMTKKIKFLFGTVLLTLGYNTQDCYAQNLQYVNSFTVNSLASATFIELDSNSDIGHISFSGDVAADKNNSDNRDTSILNSLDAFLIKQSRSGEYIWHRQIAGSGKEEIMKNWKNNSGDIFTLVRSNSDTLYFNYPLRLAVWIGTLSGSMAYHLIKYDRNGEYKGNFFLGSNFVISSLSSFIRNEELDFVVHVSQPYIIPNKTDTVFATNEQQKFVGLKINLATMQLKNYFLFDFWSTRVSTGSVIFDYAGIWVAYAVRYPFDSTFRSIISFGEGLFGLTDTITVKGSFTLESGTYHNDTLYLITKAAIGTYYLSNHSFLDNSQFALTKWVSGVLVSKKYFSSNYSLKLGVFNSEKGKLYFYGYASDVDQSNEPLEFFIGNKYYFDKPRIGFWGPILNDSLEWISYISEPGQTAFNGYNNFFASSTGDQYLSGLIGINTDYDPGPYLYVFPPLQYQGKPYAAKYNCKPHSIFSYTKKGGKVTFTNLSTGSDQFKWFFGHGNVSTTEKHPIHTFLDSGDYDITLIAYNNCGNDTFIFPIYIGNLLGVKSITDREAVVFPNPATSSFSIEGAEIGSTVTMYNALGMQVFSEVFLTDPQRFNIGSFVKGTYFLKVDCNLKIRVFKLIKI
jgi:hypothetical protein